MIQTTIQNETYQAVRNGEKDPIVIWHGDELEANRILVEKSRKAVEEAMAFPMVNADMIAARKDIIEGIEAGIHNSSIAAYLTQEEVDEIAQENA